jgi:peptide deformylase
MVKTKGKVRQKNRKKKLTRRQGKFLSYQQDMISNIRTFDDPALKEKCSDVETKEEAEEIVLVLRKVLFATETGVGIAAPQVGIAKNVAVIRTTLSSNYAYSIVNPVITEHSEEKIKGMEGCLSYPGVFTEIERYRWIDVKFFDKDMASFVKRFRDKEGVIVAHEMDHLRGICLVGDFWASKR